MSTRLSPVRTLKSRSSRTLPSRPRPRRLGCIASPRSRPMLAALSSGGKLKNPVSKPGSSTCATGRRSDQGPCRHQTTVPTKEDHMAVMTEPSADDTTIRPFTIETPEAELEDLRARIAATRFPEKEPVDDLSQGVQLATMQALAHYWATEYDWRKCEARLKALPHFITEIDGLDIHFVHVRSEHEDAMPLLVAHGWPGSVIEQLKIIDPLSNPTAHGASGADAFHLVIPSMAGYAYSGKPTTPGWGPARMARAWVELMKRLGYNRFAAQGGDWGGFVTNLMAQQAPPELIGIHVNFSGAAPPEVARALQFGEGPPASLSADEQRAYDQMAFLYQHVPTQLMMAAHPQTLYGLADSPVALAAWMIDHDVASY